MPLDTAHIWGWFQDLNAARSSGMAANPLSFTEIDAYCRLNRLVMSPWEIGLLRQVDAEALHQSSGKAKPASPAEKPPVTPAVAAEAKQLVSSVAPHGRRVVKRQPKREAGA